MSNLKLVQKFRKCVLSCAVAGAQPLSPAEMQAVMMASERETLHRQQDTFAEKSPHQQYQAMMTGRAGE